MCSKIAALDSKLAFQHWKPVTAVNVGYGYVSFPFPDWQGSLLHVEARRQPIDSEASSTRGLPPALRINPIM